MAICIRTNFVTKKQNTVTEPPKNAATNFSRFLIISQTKALFIKKTT